ncbi:homeotic protein female sterile isoform X2 [Hippocampus comes]|uniref:homeotic protein female sterile isoform X2 n=1 Tax=Hippocampus comes TaxID=109280 RepID=UPI00094E4629|nr:PREDICTED: homeotic protein female sterile-like isoform X2 [Hippocampus comes]
MWCPSLLHASLLLCLARQTLQGGVKAHSMSWRRIMPARVGVGIGTKGVNGAHGAMGSRYVNKPLKAGVGHYAVPSPLGVMGYQPLGQGFVPGRFPAYGNPGLYGGNLGTGLPLGHAPANGHGLGHGGNRVYGVNPVTGFAPYAGMGYPAVRPGVSAAELGRLEEAARSQAAQDPKRAKNRALGGPEESGRSTMGTRSGNGFGSEVMSTGSGLKILDPKPKMSSLGPTTRDSSLGQAIGGAPEPSVLTHGERQPQSVGKDKLQKLASAASPAQTARNHGSARPQRRKNKNCGSLYSPNNHRELSSSGMTPRLAPNLARQAPTPDQHRLLSSQDARLQTPTSRIVLSSEQKNPDVPNQQISGTLGKQVSNPQVQESQRNIPLSPETGFSLAQARVQEGNGGAGNYLGGNVAPGSYGPALGQGGYLGAAGKLGAALGQGGYTKGVSTGYANGAGPYGGALAGNGLGYGNGYANPYGAALGTGSYAGQPQVPYGGLSAGLDPAAGKYGGAPPVAASQDPYGGTPLAPARLEGDGGSLYPSQPIGLSGDGSKSASKHGSAYGAPQAGYLAQPLGPSQDALGAKASKYGAGTGPLGVGYRG